MLTQILLEGGLGLVFAAFGLVAVTVTIHAIGFSALIRALIRSQALTKSGLGRSVLSTIGLTGSLTLIHLLEISVWGLFYVWQDCLPDAESAMYFSGVTYTSVGYGDIVLPQRWRLLAPLEALTGMLMIGVSTGLFFAVASQWINNAFHGKILKEPQPDPAADQ